MNRFEQRHRFFHIRRHNRRGTHVELTCLTHRNADRRLRRFKPVRARIQADIFGKSEILTEARVVVVRIQKLPKKVNELQEMLDRVRKTVDEGVMSAVRNRIGGW